MTDSGRLNPEPPGEGSDERDYAALIDSALLDSIDQAQQPDEALEAILHEMAPGARRDTAEMRAARIEIDRRIVARARRGELRRAGHQEIPVDRVRRTSCRWWATSSARARSGP